MHAEGIAALPRLSSEPPPKFTATKLNIKAILNALNFDPTTPTTPKATPPQVITRICNRFHYVARQMLSRHDKRETLTIRDEYDVQDLLHSLLVSGSAPECPIG
ncbi:MAG: hypothetical protein ACLP5V_05680 [Candidatus Bathyarchaeia archaeon]